MHLILSSPCKTGKLDKKNNLTWKNHFNRRHTGHEQKNNSRKILLSVLPVKTRSGTFFKLFGRIAFMKNTPLTSEFFIKCGLKKHFFKVKMKFVVVYQSLTNTSSESTKFKIFPDIFIQVVRISCSCLFFCSGSIIE